MKHIFPLLFYFFASSVMAQEPDSSSALFSMRETERNFARASAAIGRNAAFTEYFAEKSVLFTGKWINNGKQFSKESKASPVVLKWEPEYMDISDSRDFGISTGPWEVQEYRPNTAPLATGYFLTVWKKQSDGTWMVILDGGSETPPLTNSRHSFSFPAGADKAVKDPKVINIDISSKELSEREKQIQERWKESPLSSTYSLFLAPKARVQYSRHLPTTSPDTINALVRGLDKTMLWTTNGAGAASSGDLGFTYGLLQTQGDSVKVKGHYVRIWRKQPGSDWMIVLEMMNFN
jgi:ketosteroid isomerase-like protein